MSWSYKQLVKEYGEDIAILLLEFMDGFGEYDPHVYPEEEQIVFTECCIIHDEVPIKFKTIQLWDYKDDVGVVLSAWRQEKKSMIDNTELQTKELEST